MKKTLQIFIYLVLGIFCFLTDIYSFFDTHIFDHSGSGFDNNTFRDIIIGLIISIVIIYSSAAFFILAFLFREEKMNKTLFTSFIIICILMSGHTFFFPNSLKIFHSGENQIDLLKNYCALITLFILTIILFVKVYLKKQTKIIN